MKLIVKCPTCEWKGITNSLAEYLPEEGILSIRRSNQLIPGQTTIIVGQDYSIICGNCKEIVFKKTPVLIQETTTMIFGTM